MLIFLRGAILAVLCIFLVLIGVGYFSFGSSFQQEQFENALLKGDLLQAQEELELLERSLSRGDFALAQAYFHFHRGEFKQAMLRAESASSSLIDHKKKVEALVLRAVISYSSFSREDLERTLSEFKMSFPGKEAYKAIRFILDLHDGNVGKDDSCPSFPIGNSSLSKAALQKFWGKAQERSFQAGLLIKQGKILEGRDLLESKGGLNPLGRFYMGLSYLKEAHGKPAAARFSYTSLGTNYLMSKEDSIACLWEQAFLEEYLTTLALDSPELNDWDSYFAVLEVLERWQRKESSEKLATALKKQVSRLLEDKRWDRLSSCCTALARMEPSSPLRCSVEKLLKTQIGQILPQGQKEELPKLWEAVAPLASGGGALASQSPKETAQRILTQLESESLDGPELKRLLHLWDVLERNPVRRIQLAEQLLEVASKQWIKSEMNSSALALLNLSSKVPFLSDRERHQEKIQLWLQDRFQKEEQQRHFIALIALDRQAQTLGLPALHRGKEKEIPNLLEDAQVLLKAGNTQHLLELCQWILHLEERHPLALQFYGVAQHRLGNFEETVAALEGLQKIGPSAVEALGLSLFEVGRKKDGALYLEKLSQQHALSDKSYGLLGEFLLEQGQPEASIQYFRLMKEATEETMKLKAQALKEAQMREKDHS